MSMRPLCRVIDSGVQSGATNEALDRRLLEACEQGRYDALLRFHRYRPTVSLGIHEPFARAVRPDYCRERGIDIVRRGTGGGALYLDPGQLCWTLVMQRDRDRSLGEWMAFFSEGTRLALSELGIHARFAFPNDIEVENRKIASGFVSVRDQIVIFQGVLLLDLDIETALKALRAPTEKLSPEGMQSARQRMITLQEVLDGRPILAELQDTLVAAFGSQLKREFLCMPGPPPGRGAAARPTQLRELDMDWEAQKNQSLQAFIKTAGGVLYAHVRLDGSNTAIERLTLAGSVQMHPADLFLGLQEWMRGVRIAEWETQLNAFFGMHACDGIGFTLHDIYRLVRLTLARMQQQESLALTPAQANTLMVHGGDASAPDILAQATVMLVPYCAKPIDCKWRNRDGCPECGLCEVGDAYRLARERGMRVISITNYEHLRSVLDELRTGGTQAYVGMCCEHFYTKRQHAFREAGIPAVLMDITGANCYELQEEDLAYAGKFMAQAHLNMEVVEKVMHFVPRCGESQPRRRPRQAVSPEKER